MMFGTGKVRYGLCALRAAMLTVLMAVAISACATLPPTKSGPVKPGDQADVHFTCRFKNGELVTSTYEGVPGDPSQPRSSIFVPRTTNTPLALTAGKKPVELQSTPVNGLEDEVVYHMTNAIVGMRTGDKKTLEIKADAVSSPNSGEYLIKMARVRYRPKEVKFTPEEYTAKSGKQPVPGDTYILDPALPGKVESVNDTEVVVHFAGKQGEQVDTPFGKGTVGETPDRYEIAIDARPGTLVRSGTMIGRIVNVDDRNITIDYGHPFGGEPLVCDVLIESVKPMEQERMSGGKQQ